jgi:hypothetical protein
MTQTLLTAQLHYGNNHTKTYTVSLHRWLNLDTYGWNVVRTVETCHTCGSTHGAYMQGSGNAPSFPAAVLAAEQHIQNLDTLGLPQAMAQLNEANAQQEQPQ